MLHFSEPETALSSENRALSCTVPQTSADGNGQVGIGFALVQFDRDEVFFGEDRQQLFFDFGREPQGKATVSGQLPGNRDQEEFHPGGFEDFLCLEDLVDRMEYGDEIVLFDHQHIL